MTVQTGSIRSIHRRLTAEGIQISEYALRRWVKSGLIPAVYSGSKAIISYETVQSFLRGKLVET